MKYIYFFSGLTLSLAWLLPNHYFPWLTVFQEVSAVVAIILLFIGSYTYATKLPVWSLWAGVIILLPVFQYLIGVIYFNQDMLLNSSYLLFFWLSFVVAFNLIINQEYEQNKIIKSNINNHVIEGFLLIVIISSIINVWIALRQWFMFEGNIWTVDLAIGSRPYGNFGQPNHLSSLINLSLISTLILFENNRLNKYVASLLTIFLLIGSAITQSRTAWVFAALLPMWWLIKGRYINLKISIKYLSIWLVSYITILLVIPYFAKFIGLYGYTNYSQRVTAGYERIKMWEQVIYSFSNEPFFGYGWGQFRSALMTTVDIFEGAKNFESSHNLFLDLIIWNGLPIGLVLSTMILWLIIKILQTQLTKMAFLWLTCAMPIFIHSMLEYPLSYAFFLLPFGFLLGLAYGSLKLQIKLIIISKPIKAIFLTIVLIGITIFLRDFLNIFGKTQQIRYQIAKIGDNSLIEEDTSKYIFTDKLAEYVWFFGLDIHKSNLSKEDFTRIERFIKLNPDYPVLLKYINILYKNNETEKAHEYELIMKTFYPKMFKSTLDTTNQKS